MVSRRGLFGLTGIMGVVLIAAWLTAGRDAPGELPDVPAPGGAESESAEVDVGQESGAPPMEPATRETETTLPAARRLAPVPDSRRAAAEETDGPPQDHAQEVLDQVEAALGGSPEAAIMVLGYVRTCQRLPATEEGALLFAETWPHQKNSKFTLEPEGVAGRKLEFLTVEDWSAEFWRQFDRCQARRELLDGELRSRIQAQARAGHPVARFLYATWPPTINPQDPDSFLERLAYADLAYEFTLQNIQEKEPLGVLALGLSYQSFLFTAHNSYLSHALMLAAEKCGLAKQLLGQVNRYHDHGVAQGTREAAEIIAQELC